MGRSRAQILRDQRLGGLQGSSAPTRDPSDPRHSRSAAASTSFGQRYDEDVLELTPEGRVTVRRGKFLTAADRIPGTSVTHTFRSISTSQKLRDLDDVLLVDTTAGIITVTLPKAALLKGREFGIKRVVGGSNNVVIDPDGSELIDGASTHDLSTLLAAVTITSTGTTWYIR